MIEKRQANFEKVVRALALQGRRSFKPIYGCLYRHPEGLKCAIGHLIPDEEYDPWMEGYNISGLSQNFQTSLSEPILNDTTFYLRIQRWHDSPHIWESIRTFKNSARVVAEVLRIDGSFIDSLEFGET